MTDTRAVLYVPTYDSLLGLGAAYYDEDTDEQLSQPGFTMSTTAHVFFRAASSVTVQANGLAWFQSTESSTYAVAGKSAYYVAGKDLYIGGGSCVGLMAGFVADPTGTKNDFSDATPGMPTAANDLENAFFAADLSFGVFEKLINLANLAKFLQQEIYLKHWDESGWLGLKKWKNRGWIILKSVGTLWSAGAWTYYRLSEYPYLAASMYSEAGILIGTPSVCTIFGGIQAAYRSLNTTLFGIGGVVVEGGYSATIDSVFGETLVSTASSLSVLTLDETKLVSRAGTVAFYGADIEFGGLFPSGKQLPTKKMNLTAAKSIDLKTLLPASSTIELGSINGLGGTTSLEGFIEVKVESEINTKIIHLASFTIECTPAAITIKGTTGELLKLTPTMITLGPATGQIKLTPTLCDVGGGSLQITPAGLTTMFSTVDVL